MYEIQRLRSHEKDNIPQAWETIYRNNNEEKAADYLYECHKSLGASGDQLRVKWEDRIISVGEFLADASPSQAI